MTDPEQPSDTIDGVDARSLAKGTALAGLAGSALTGTASAHPNEILFRSVAGERFKYEVTVTGEIHRGDWTEASDEIVDEHTARGQTSDGGGDDYTFSGDIEDLRLAGPGKVFVNGEKVIDTSKEAKKDRDERKKPGKHLPNEMTVAARGEKVHYKFRVGGAVRKGPNAGDSDDIDGDTVRGTVSASGVDDFRYSGPLSFDEPDGPLEVSLHLDE